MWTNLDKDRPTPITLSAVSESVEAQVDLFW
jgi:hypothetical protein